MPDSLFQRIDVYASAAALAAHASFIEAGFRLRDMRFFAELFLNWSEDFDPVRAPFQTTQLTRYVEELVKQGFARRATRNRVKYYNLTRLGLLELLTRLTSTQTALPTAQMLFRLCFLKSYKPWLERLVERGGAQFPPALAMELAALLDVETLVEFETKRLERALARLDRRIEDALKISSLTTNRMASGVALSEVVREVESRYPYELNSMKPLHELISSIAPDQRCWELQQGNLLRVHTIWEPQRAILRETLARLQCI